MLWLAFTVQFRTFCAIKCDMLWVLLTVQCQDILCHYDMLRIPLTVPYQDILCHYVRYVLGTTDSSVSGHSVPLNEIGYDHH